MKKHHPHPSANPEALYAQVNKQNRGNQRRPNPEEEVLYASVNTIDPLSRGRHHNQKHQESETDYTTVAPSRREEEVVYASVSSIDPLSRGGRHNQRQQESETDYATVSPQQRGRTSLTTDQISVHLLKNPHVQAYGEEIIHWSSIVYGKDNLFQQHLQGILKDPHKGKDLSDQLAENPESMGKLAGRHALGMKSQTRKQAEEGFRHLVNAIDGYTKAVTEARDRILQTPHAEQRRQQEHSQSHHHHRHHHTRGQEQNSPEHSPRQQKHGMAYAM
ncbi:BID domain-containing T4SS effector [Bartonella mastomydis]|uniref:BID domain-containing T4SS effector n=1 Tax=Bartonella mastomydis TaxID=1820002 RepID=UPI0011166F1B|nr:BID domain-containing T4SS effector [Bartonella mastomydis]